MSSSSPSKSSSQSQSDSSLLSIGSRPHGALIHSMQKPQIGTANLPSTSLLSRVRMFLDGAEDSKGDEVEVLKTMEPELVEHDGDHDGNTSSAAGENSVSVEMNLALGVFEEKERLDESEEVRAYSELMESLMGKGNNVEDDDEQNDPEQEDDGMRE
eukprot:CAMPEP_0117451106 /NCGR_PEP_ID=MMETSP0759-20121206/8827_1 /TAXON_ID=63605 /ORGANISM="Percolomonas cosmopolitus, Strain WS" /LENGTH=156 /DNA_ID=CAMNT_0005243677 /DNA_START=17 /DNA_END=487 /DNA_ORIENTATION=-